MIRSAAGSCTLMLLLFGCAAQPITEASSETSSEAFSQTNAEAPAIESEAAVTAVAVSGEADDGYTFAVTIKSPDTGCSQYANWWEVVTEEGELLYRRVLAHSHVEEQPFTRSGGPVVAQANDRLVVRSHTDPTGYSAQAMQGTISEGFEPVILPPDFALELAEAEPQPSGCAF